MADPVRPATDSVIAKLVNQPYDFDFFAAVRQLQSCFCELPRIGHSRSPAKDPVRFAQSPALDFASSTLEAMQRKEAGSPPVLYCRHFGLFGPNGPLPLALTEYAHDRILHHGDPTFAAFCNIFHHRLLSFFFRAWADAQKSVDFDRPGDQRWAQFTGSLIGLGMPSLRDRESLPDRAALYFAGRLVQQSRNAEGLEAILQEFFALRTEVQTFVGRWLQLRPGPGAGDSKAGQPSGYACKLGESPDTGVLGATLIIGSRFWTCQLHFRLRMGPMTLAQYERMLPGGSAFRRLRDWVRLYAGEHFSWDLQLVLDRTEVPSVQIGKAGKLGWTTWLKTRPFTQDAGDLVLQPPPD